MHSISVLAFVASALAAPPVTPRGGFVVQQQSVGKQYVSGAIDKLETFQKFGAAPPASLVEAAAAAQSGSVTASPEQYDVEYLSPVKVGAQTLELDFDTGSSDLWVFSTLQPASQRQGHTAYNPSSGTKEKGEKWSIKYGDGSSAKGIVYSDKVVVGGVTATKQDVEAATAVSARFRSDKQDDGILGLAFPSINTCKPKKCTPFFQTVQSTLAQPLFTVGLKKGAPGKYTFGYIDSSLYSGSITYVPVDSSEGFWGFTAGAFSVGGGGSAGAIGASIVDTGTTLWYLPPADSAAYYSQVSGAVDSPTYGGWVFPCGSSLPSASAVIGGTKFTVPGSYINFAPANAAGTVCFGGIQDNTGLPFSIFGDIFLKSKYVVFKPTTKQLGFANP